MNRMSASNVVRISLIIVFLLLFTYSAWLTWTHPARFPPPYPNCGNQLAYVVGTAKIQLLTYTVSPLIGGGDPAAHCAAVYKQYNTIVAIDTQLTYTHEQYGSIALSFLALACLIPLVSMKRLNFPWLHKALSPDFLRWAFVPVVVVGAAIFGFLSVVDATYYDLAFSHNLIVFIQTNHNIGFGVLSFGVWGLTLLVATIRLGFVRAMKYFGWPTLLYLQINLLIFLSQCMPIHVTQFMTLSVRNVYLLPNILILTVSVFFVMYQYGQDVVRVMRAS